MNTPAFIHETKVTLGDTTIYGNVYFAKYFEWQGKARELFFLKLIPGYKEFNEKYKMITIESTMNYGKEAMLFDELIINIDIKKIRITTYEVHFTFINKLSNEQIATGKQKIGFTNMNGKVVPIPPQLIGAWMKHSLRG